jgi:hypothetical protein
MTFAQLKADIYRRLGYSATPPAGIQTRVGSFINEAHREMLALPGLSHLRDDVLTVTAVANYGRMGLPSIIARIKAVVDRTNNHRLRPVPLSELRLDDPAQAFTGGYPLQYSVCGYQQVQFQPATATGLWAVSSSSSDASGPKVFAETITTGGYRHVTSTTGTFLTGTSRVQLGTRTDSVEVHKFYVDQPCVGYISLYNAATVGVELARIEPTLTYARYLAVEFWPVQTTDTTLYIDCTRAVFDLVQDTDEPMLPPDFHYVLGIGARMKEYELVDDSRITQARADYLRGQAALRSWVLNDGDRTSSLRHTPVRWSQLGPMFPSGS